MWLLILLLPFMACAADFRKIDAGIVEYKHQTTPATPFAGYTRGYCKADGFCYKLLPSGVETKFLDGTITVGSITGTLPIANGGTNSSTALSNDRVMQSSGGAIIEAAAITASRALKSDANGIPVASTATAASLDALNGTNTGDQTITLTSDVTGSGTGSFATTIAADAVTNSKLANMAANSIKGNNTGGSADPLDLTTAQVKTMLDLTGTNSGDQTITLTSDVTGTGTGSFATTIANDAVTYAKMQNVSAASKLLGRGDSGSGDVQEITLGTGLTMTGTTLAASGGGGGGMQATNWASYTPTFTGLGTPTGVNCFWRRVGGSYELLLLFTPGTTTGTPGLISLPNSKNIDTVSVPVKMILGTGGRAQDTSIQYMLTGTGGGSTLEIAVQDASFNPYTSQNANSVVGSIKYSFHAMIPIDGLDCCTP